MRLQPGVVGLARFRGADPDTHAEAPSFAGFETQKRSSVRHRDAEVEERHAAAKIAAGENQESSSDTGTDASTEAQTPETHSGADDRAEAQDSGADADPNDSAEN